MTPARTVTYDGETYKVRGQIEIPNLDTLDRFDALQWLCRYTYARGYSKPNPLAGLSEVIEVKVR